ncbi:MAG: YihY/virulence factor BrkB family protein [Mycoplasmataceae bacterium]|nr:YihY/virulence factor BrkB family protein [Mycoplasmataceae bacterium]
MKKPSSGYSKKPKEKKKKEKYLSHLFVSPQKKVTVNEKIVKFLIYLALRLAIRPKKWKEPKKNYEIIDRTYKRIMSADFIFIPSSIAFYLMMAFMPILSLIAFLYSIPTINNELTEWDWVDKDDSNFHAIFKDSSGTWFSDSSHTHALSNQKIIVMQHITRDSLSEILGKFIPGIKGLLDQLRNLFTDSGSSASKSASTAGIVATVLSLFVSTWISAAGFSKLVFTQSYIYEHKFVGGYWMNKIKGMFMVVGFTLFLFSSLAINILLERWIDTFSVTVFWKDFILRTILIVGLSISTFSGTILLYKFSPRYKIKIRDVIPGAMVTSIPSFGFLALFGTISSLWSYGSYGIVGVIMYVGMAAMIITYFIFVGIITNAAYYKTFVGAKVKNKWTLSNK